MAAAPDRFGLGWRPELAAELLPRLARVDAIEVVAEAWLDAPRRDVAALRALARDVPTWIHGTGLGLASSVPVDGRRLDRLARLVDAVDPAGWSEHLAFVRAGGIEIGHLAAPPRSAAVVDGTAANVARARAVVGSLPHLENVATLVEPPGPLSETAFLRDALGACGTGLLLDLHNLHANATNAGIDPSRWLDDAPLERVSVVHLAGGRVVRTPAGRPLVLDDHLHPVPDPVLHLLAEVGRRVRGPLTVILERDGRYPPADVLLAEVDVARAALARGRAQAA